ncbi:MAG: acyltransferase [Candidatus Accumulibacter sp.]|uniref:Acyltransferase n=1 Tax=Candidatus Accumulibacter affinis TaxID=2954384 RepID=A0A935TEX5_9PROT|nr:acyltransferase [Candidatus Accumulibacter affinis]
MTNMLDSSKTHLDFDRQDHLQVVDALRGYAILMVIAVHSIGHNEDLVWPAMRPLALGFYGVQLFFLASALTLLMSWSRSDDSFARRSGKFLIRRFFRIAPLYYLAVVFYWFAYSTPPADFSFKILLASLLFYNAWSPYLIPTVPGWTPVPGGWSIGVEFFFYFTFPFLALLVGTLRRAIVFFVVALAIMIAAFIGGGHLYPEITYEERANFLYFWPPNQLVIFSLGFLLYHCVTNKSVRQWIMASRITANGASIALCCVLFGLSFYGPRKSFDWSSFLPPTHLLISLFFLPWAIVLVIKPKGWAINTAIIGLGQVSFSAYILHFAVLAYVGTFLKHVWPLKTVGVLSIAYSAALLVAAIVITRYVSGLSYRHIEQPFIKMGKSFIRRIYPDVENNCDSHRRLVQSSGHTKDDDHVQQPRRTPANP